MTDSLRRENKANTNCILMHGEILLYMQFIETSKPMEKITFIAVSNLRIRTNKFIADIRQVYSKY